VHNASIPFAEPTMTAAPDLIQPAWQRLDPHTCQLGESPFWHPQEQTLYWVDITGKQLLRMQAGHVQTWDMPSEPGCIAPAQGVNIHRSFI
jgi:sugar lactone lactonase YvrE